MKFTSFLIISFLFANSIFGQTTNKKIKVILLGTFHYGATSDRGKTSFPDLFSKKRQTELDSIAKKLVNVGVNKFFLETPVLKQKNQDSLYASYIAKTLLTQLN